MRLWVGNARLLSCYESIRAHYVVPMVRPNRLQFTVHFFGAAAGALTGARTLGATNFVGALTGARTGVFMKLCSNADLLSGKNTFPSPVDSQVTFLPFLSALQSAV
jgi:hypothetical protein